jgi:hypothetical protein
MLENHCSDKIVKFIILIPGLIQIFFQVTTHLTMFHKSPAYAGVKIYNHLPSDIKDSACAMRSFKKALNNFLHVHSFYAVDEFFMYKVR